MRKRRKSMALRAMVFLSLLIGVVLAGGCGSDASEAVDTLQEGLNSADSREPETEEADSKRQEDASSEASDTIFVYVCGAVASPGVYELPEYARVYEAIEAAGGLREDADSVHTNQAKILSDGEQITVLTAAEAQNAAADTEGGSGNGSGTGETKVNINTASVSELMTLSGIGESRAGDIISYREEHGQFQKTEDIMKVTGIKTALYTKIKDHICV